MMSGTWFPQALEFIIEPVKRLRDLARSLPYRGTGRWCPVCGNSAKKFRPFGIVRREEAQCVFCGALERHRFAWAYFEKKTDLFDEASKRMLHIAPEKCMEPNLKRRLGRNYLTADLLDPHAMVRMDVTDIQYPEESFDVIYCSHVLEHVPDDRKAMREFHRVLKRNGWAIVLVPITVEKTMEDASITDPVERLKAFGQKDHVRRYGPDYEDRLREAGFDVTMSRVSDLFDENDAMRMGLTPASGEIYFCTKATMR